MKLNRHHVALILAFFLAGCSGRERHDWQIGSLFSVMHGQVDFDKPPKFEWSFGSYKSVMCFERTTVIRFVGTYYIIGAPYYVVLAGIAAPPILAAAVWRFRRRRKHKQAA